MNFKNKIILFIIIGLLLVAGLLVSIFYLQKNNNLSEKEQLEIKTECLEEINKISKEEFIEEINNLTFVNEEKLLDIEDYKKSTFAYLVCQATNEKKEFDGHVGLEIYYRTANLIQKLDISDELKNNILGLEELGGMFYQWDESDENKILFLNRRYVNFSNIAVKPIEEICPGGERAPDFLENCLRSGLLHEENIGKLSAEQIEETRDNCNYLCDYLKLSIEDPSSFKNTIKDIMWFDDLKLLEEKMYTMSSVFFNAGGKELSLELCDSIPNLDMKKRCEHYITSLDYINCKDFGFNKTKECKFRKYEACEVFYDKAKDLICESNMR